MQATYSFNYDIYDSPGELSPENLILFQEAIKATAKSYAPYSHFRVGAAARLANGEIISGGNQENASFPAGLCAEGVVMATAASQFPGMAIDTLAISYHNEQGSSDRPISPCGICRQSLQEFEQKTGSPVKLLLGGETGQIFLIQRATALLPFAFSADELGPDAERG